MSPPSRHHGPCWIALRLPHLALDRVSRGQPTHRPLPVAIVADRARRQVVTDCNPAATRLGVRPGMPLASALALAEALQAHPEDVEADRRRLDELAAWAYQYSSEVAVLAPRRALLLEAGASERLFGAPEALATRLVTELGRLGYHARAGRGVTPAAARLAADTGLDLATPGTLRARIADLPIETLEIAPARCAALRGMGLRRVRELLRLPRKGLARRIGPEVVEALDRLLGDRPDPLPRYRPPDTFSAGFDLLAEIGHSEALLFPLRRLVEQLCGVLRARDRGIQQLTVRLRHEGEEESGIHLGLQRPTREAERLMLLLRERLERLRLPAPVRHVQLDASRLLAFEAGQEALFDDQPGARDAPVAPLLERLQARLGREAVRGLHGVEDHRPEYSWAPAEPARGARCTPLPHRPVWLLPEPRRCRIDEYRLLAGPERIESGWWDGRDQRRDYFVVQDARGGLWWAYRAYKPTEGWYLHGLFA